MAATPASKVGPVIMTALAVVVLVQAAVLAWLLLISPDRDRTLAGLRDRPVETIVELCTPAVG